MEIGNSRMNGRTLLLFVALSAIGGVAVLHWSEPRVHDDPAKSAGARPARSPVERGATVSAIADTGQSGPQAAKESEDEPAAAAATGWPQPTSSSEDVARWIADATSADAQKRAAAISALGGAPKADALPVLRRIVHSGAPEVDRPLALRSLRDLALYQGDEDGGIRTVVREVIYHGDDERMTRAAQDTLDVIEESEMK